MSFSSKPKKIKPKGQVRELKLVQTTNRHGADTIKMEEVKTPRKNKATSTNRSLSPVKRQKLEAFDTEPIPFSLDGHDESEKRQTLVCFLS
jgi:hypothetical protein